MDTYIILTDPIYLSDRKYCGYCHCEKEDHYGLESMKPKDGSSVPAQSTTMGFSVQHMTCQDYDEFINKGFRRSGSFLYKTDPLRNCCRYYTIRTSYGHFKLTKKHRKIVNRFIREISDDSNPSSSNAKKNGSPYNLEALVEAERKSTVFHTKFEPSVFTREKYELYKKYQIRVHNDDPEEVSESQFERFLCDNPFGDEEQSGTKQQWETLNQWRNPNSTATSSGTSSGRRIGPTHECYYLRDKLIAISVTDYLPSGLSSIYFIWDPDYAHLSLGTLSGIRELLMIKYLQMDYYYLGYYIEDCPKMVYKDQFGGELLDLANEMYFPIDKVKPYIKNSRLFTMGTDNDLTHKAGEIPMTNEFPNEKSLKQAAKGIKYTTNIAETIYTESTFIAAENAAKAIGKLAKVDLSKTNFPHVIPGLMPLPQLQRIIEQDVTILYDMALTFFSMHTGSIKRDKPFSTMTNKEKITAINCIRLFGLQKLDRLLIMTT